MNVTASIVESNQWWFNKSTFEKKTMKKLIICFMVLTYSTLNAQTIIQNKAIVYTTMNIIATEEEESRGGDGEGRQGMNFRNMMDGETKITTTILNDKIKN